MCKRSPALSLIGRWVLASSAGRSHLICMPGVTREAVDAFVADVAGVADVADGALLDALPRRRAPRALVR